MLKQNILYINIYKQLPLSQRLFVNNYFCKKNCKTNQGFRVHKKKISMNRENHQNITMTVSDTFSISLQNIDIVQ